MCLYVKNLIYETIMVSCSESSTPTRMLAHLFFVVTISLGFKVANALRPESIVLVYSTEWEGWQD